jgi:GNAT superfamily N-acetyltransferase
MAEAPAGYSHWQGGGHDSSSNPGLRPAQREDASVLAELVNYAGEGLPLYLWTKLAEPGETAWDVGRRRAAREEGSFSYRNATIIEHDGRVAGSLIGYAIADDPEPIPSDIPAMFWCLQELENLAPGTWYVNVLAVLPECRVLGLGSDLLRLADDTGRRLGKRGMSGGYGGVGGFPGRVGSPMLCG